MSMTTQTRDATVIGLGEMGTALAGALLRTGHHVTVFNRTPARAEELVRQGVALAPSASAAIRASDVTLICVSDYAAATELLAGATAADLEGRTLVHLSSGTPREVRDLAAAVAARGARYLDGAILAWPRQIGQADAAILVSGPRDLYEKHEPLLKALGGGVAHYGQTISSSAALAAAALAYLAGKWIGFAHGALICEAEGLNPAEFGAMLAGIAPVLGEDDRHMGEVVSANRFSDPESTLRTTGNDIAGLVSHARQAGISEDFPTFAADLFRRAIDAGYGKEEHVAIIKVLRAAGLDRTKR
jgi:3-hydroxyisobutyrate dehydrogenase-like beta-hydroxyacid dehydrogenase